jgi:quinohemoprotein amine dehydrogenase
MTRIFRKTPGIFVLRQVSIFSQIGGLAFWSLIAGFASGQSNQTANQSENGRQRTAANENAEGIPVTDPLVIAKCGACHGRDEHGNMQRLSWERTTPEGWQDALKQMILLQGLSVTPTEARSIVKYLSSSHGLAPEEAEPVMYDAERRIHEESGISSDLHDACAKCHSFARALSRRRPIADWQQFLDSHAARYKISSTTEAAAFLSTAAALHTPAWDAWSRRAINENLAGRWLVSAYMPGRGKYYGEMQINRDGDDEYSTRVTLRSVKDGSQISRSGRTTLFGGSAWRGRSSGSSGGNTADGTSGAIAPDDPSSEAREVLLIARNQATAAGRWFWGQYQEFGFDVKLQRASSNPTVIGIDRPALKTGSRANRVRLVGDHFPAEVAVNDLGFGPGISVRKVLSNSLVEIVAELDVAADASPGTRDVSFRQSVLPDAIAIYDRIDYIKVTPDSTVAAFGDGTHAKGYQQFEAIGYQRGPDGRSHTADDVALGPVDVTWSVQVFHAAEGSRSDSVGAMSPLGLFIPADANPKLNFDVWVIATARVEKDQNGEPMVGKSYMVLTVPTYTFNGRRYVRDLDRWVDDGPAPARP